MRKGYLYQVNMGKFRDFLPVCSRGGGGDFGRYRVPQGKTTIFDRWNWAIICPQRWQPAPGLLTFNLQLSGESFIHPWIFL